MTHSSYHDPSRRARRTFLLGTAAGLAAGAPLGWLGLRTWQELPPGRRFTGRGAEDPRPEYAMPGPFPGKVVEVRHPGAVRPDNTICADAVREMTARGMCGLTGADHPAEAWRRFFQKGDVVGVKVNPSAASRNPARAAAASQRSGPSPVPKC